MHPQLFLIRHGQSEGNIGISDHPNCDLTPLGLEQATRAAEQMAAFDLAGFAGLVSPYCRARRTAEAIARRTGLRFEVDPDVREWGADCRIDDATYRLESREELAARIEALYAKLCGRRCVIVAHAAPIALLLQLAAGKKLDVSGQFWTGVENAVVYPV